MMELPLNITDVQKVSSKQRYSWCLTWFWLLTTFAVFTLSWAYTNGGYECCVPICVLIIFYCYHSHIFNPRALGKALITTIRYNILHLFKNDKRSVTLIVIYWLFKIAMVVLYPQGEQSNGSPYSLVFFTVLFLALYIVPTMVHPITYICSSSLQFLKSFYSSRKAYSWSKRPFQRLLHQGWRWRRSIVIIATLVVLTYIFDADITSILRYIGKGKPCWPLLAPRQMKKTLPYSFQHARLSNWHVFFTGYKPSMFIKRIISLGREMGEVCRLLPVLIGTYIFVQLLVPREYTYLKHTLFACIAGVILGGCTSGSFKVLLHRYRPNAYGNPYVWKGPGTTVVNHFKFSKLDLSFPAGHTTVTSAVATCLYQAAVHALRPTNQMSMWLRLWIGLCTYFYPMVVMLSRVSDCYHWSSDTVFGVCTSL